LKLLPVHSPETLLAPKPSDLSHEQAAALPMPALTARQGLVVHGGLEAGERVLITARAAASGMSRFNSSAR
jgi:NADPH:quinone reductase-like Zn-dependent oxidoreductase